MLKPLITCTQRVYTDTRIGMVFGFLNIGYIAMRFDGPYGKQIVSNHKVGGRENSIQLIVPLTLYALYDTEKSFISIIIRNTLV